MKKLTHEYVSGYFIQKGCKLLSRYENCKSKLSYECNCGYLAKITFSKFQNGQRCSNCRVRRIKNKQKFSIEVVRNYFKEHNCELLELNYDNTNQLLNYKCCCGVFSKITFGNFKSGHRCKKCGILKNTGKNNKSWNPNREEVRLSNTFRKKCYNMLNESFKCLNKKKKNKTIDILGYEPKTLQKYIISHPNWDSVKDTSWHLDHIFPIKAFLDYGISDLKLINCLENLQPLSKDDNLSKQGKYCKVKFKKWLLVKGITVFN